MSTGQPYDEKALIARISAGDEGAFSVLFEKYYTRIYGNALQLLKVPAMAEDIAQQVFLRVWEHRSRLNEVEQLRAWLFQIARNLIADRFREKVLEERYISFAIELLQSTGESPEDVIMHRQRADILKQALDGLSPKQRAVYSLSREEGKTYQEIAEQLGISRDTVKEYMQIALARIRQYLIDHKDELIMLILFSNIV